MKQIRARKRSKAKPARKTEKPRLKPEDSLDVPVDIPNVREQIIRLVGNGALDMVQSMVTEVKNGHYLAMKYLFEMVGLFPAIASADPVSEESLSKILLRNLGIPEESSVQELKSEPKVMKESCSPADEVSDLAVK